MASNREHFSVGEIQCIAINDGTFSYPPNWFFSNVPQEQLESSLRDHNLSLTQVVSPIPALSSRLGITKYSWIREQMGLHPPRVIC
jgi:hypothetical protein